MRSLQVSKFRAKENHFLVEGEKLVVECLEKSFRTDFTLVEIYALEPWIKEREKLIRSSGINCLEINGKQLEQISSFKTPNQAIALFKWNASPAPIHPDSEKLFLMADKIQDPGNLGTLFRLGEWFGISGILLSEDAADPLNPKVIQAGMGSVLRLPFMKTDLKDWLAHLGKNTPVYGALLDGESLYHSATQRKGVIVLGNESKGIRPELIPFITNALCIPRWQSESRFPESLNVATAAAIVLSEFSRSSHD